MGAGEHRLLVVFRSPLQEARAKACRVTVAGLAGFRRAEGVSPATIDGAERNLILSDDGDREKRRSAHFLMLDPAQLKIEVH